jgi:hypothetical protein
MVYNHAVYTQISDTLPEMLNIEDSAAEQGGFELSVPREGFWPRTEPRIGGPFGAMILNTFAENLVRL